MVSAEGIGHQFRIANGLDAKGFNNLFVSRSDLFRLPLLPDGDPQKLGKDKDNVELGLLQYALENGRVTDRSAYQRPRIAAVQTNRRTPSRHQNGVDQYPWGFVALWLKRTQQDKALFFWDQAREFHEASIGMSLQSSPLLHYYCFLNAVKALLTAKSIAFNPYHGVVADNQRATGRSISLSNEAVRLKQNGVLPSLSSYLGETEARRTHTLQELLFNLPFIHRTYCLTYTSQPDMFIPLTDCHYVLDTRTMHVHLRATLSRDFAHRRFIKRLPVTVIADPQGDGIRAVRSRDAVPITNKSLRSDADRTTIVEFNHRMRAHLVYIQGTQTLWYIKGKVSGPTRLERFPMTLTLAAMHRLSELCRYHPFELASLLAGQKNWLLSEFIELAPDQFIDEVASEITGHQFLAPNVRVAT